MAAARAHVADRCGPDGMPRRPRLAVDLVSPEWVPAVGPIGTIKKEFTAHLGGRQIGRLLLYREVGGTFDISGIGVQDIHQGQGVASSCWISPLRRSAPATSPSLQGRRGTVRFWCWHTGKGAAMGAGWLRGQRGWLLLPQCEKRSASTSHATRTS